MGAGMTDPGAFAAASFLDAALMSRPVPGQPAAANADAAGAAAKEFESFFLQQFIEAMTAGIEAPEPFGGGAGETAFRSFLNDEYAKAMARAGGVGIADRLKAEIIAMQAQGDV